MVAIELFEIEPRAAAAGCCYASEVIKRARCAEEGGHCFFFYCTALCEYRISLFIEHDNGVVCVCVCVGMHSAITVHVHCVARVTVF